MTLMKIFRVFLMTALFISLVPTAALSQGAVFPFTSSRPSVESSALDGINPTRLVIPSIELDTIVEPVSVLPNGQMGVPKSFERVGILAPGTKAGEPGNAVIAGHFDHYTGPAVFYKLKRLKAGDQVYTLDAQGHIRAFTVTAVEPYKPNEAPLDKIFGTSEKSHLNLITCHGTYSRKTKEHSHRLVVYTELNKDQEPS